MRNRYEEQCGTNHEFLQKHTTHATHTQTHIHNTQYTVSRVCLTCQPVVTCRSGHVMTDLNRRLVDQWETIKREGKSVYTHTHARTQYNNSQTTQSAHTHPMHQIGLKRFVCFRYISPRFISLQCLR